MPFTGDKVVYDLSENKWYLPAESELTRFEIDGKAPLPRNVGIFVFNNPYESFVRFLNSSVQPVSASFSGTDLEYKIKPYADSVPRYSVGICESEIDFFLRSLKKFPTEQKIIKLFEVIARKEKDNKVTVYKAFKHNWVRLFSGEEILEGKPEDVTSTRIEMEGSNIKYFRDMFLLKKYDFEFTAGFNEEKKWFFKMSQHGENYDALFDVLIDNFQLYLSHFIGMHTINRDKSNKHNTNFTLFEP